ncbi:hypothetical protein LR48_Vigan04g039600 [Vigna angularis]|uniref:Uncharacterized protein n=1 Tax=Phaseolus angularis TaxID=3914 RepID=A0A0L9UBP8_PHAAN|nr:hypothetical protein LR48_Vigan04g039600 [Vigna angularis]
MRESAEAERGEYGEDCSCQSLLDRRIQSFSAESSSGKCAFLADVDVKFCSFHLLL